MISAHPSLAQQEFRHERVMARVRPEAINRFLRDLGIKLLAGDVRPMAMGAVNAAFALATSEGPLVLRIGNTHTMFAGAKTRSEVEIMRWTQRHTELPLPEIIDFSDRADVSPLHCEYMLMRRAPGIPLARIWPSLHVGRRLELADRVAGIIAELQEVVLPHGRHVGGFRTGLRPGCLRGDRPNIGPFRSTSDCYRGLLAWTCSELELRDGRASQRLRSRLAELRCQVDDMHSQLDEGDRLGLCHNDLNLGNLMVEPSSLKITAILDWEHAACASSDEQWWRFQNFGAEGDRSLCTSTLSRIAHRAGLRRCPGWQKRRRIGQCVEASLECVFFIAAWYRGGRTVAARREDHEAHMHQQTHTAIERVERELRQPDLA